MIKSSKPSASSEESASRMSAKKPKTVTRVNEVKKADNGGFILSLSEDTGSDYKMKDYAFATFDELAAELKTALGA